MRALAASCGFGLAAVLAIGGCASLLGDFTPDGGEDTGVGSDATTGGDSTGPEVVTADSLDEDTGEAASSDGTAGDGAVDAADGGPNDAASGGDAPDAVASDAAIPDGAAPDASDAGAPDAAGYFLTCTFQSTTPVQVASLQGQASPRFQHPPQVVTQNDQSFEILEIGAGGGPYTLYWVSPNDVNQPVHGVYAAPRGVDTGFNVLSFGPVASGAAIAEQSYGLIPTNTYSLSISRPMDNPGNAPALSFSFVQLPQFNNLGFGYVELSSLADYVWSISAVPQNGDAGTLWVGESLADGGVTYGTASSSTQTGGFPIIVPVGGQYRVYLSSSPQQGGAVAYALASTSNLDGGIPPRSLSGSKTALLFDAKRSSGGGTNFGLIELDTSATATALATYRVSNVADTAIDTFKATDLPVGVALYSPSDIPITNGGGGWFGDEFMMVGVGQPDRGGFNLVWHDAQGHIRALQTGTNALLYSHMNIDGVGITLGQQLGVRFVSWNVAWSEVQTGADGGMYDVLFANQLICSN